MAPYNGKQLTIPQITPPTLSAFAQNNGFIGPIVNLWFWATAFTAQGESVVGPSTNITTPNDGLNNHSILLQWVPPASTDLRRTRIYWSTSSNWQGASFLTDIGAGFNPSFNVVGTYVQYSPIAPPLFGTAFTGNWAGGIWRPSV